MTQEASGVGKPYRLEPTEKATMLLALMEDALAEFAGQVEDCLPPYDTKPIGNAGRYFAEAVRELKYLIPMRPSEDEEERERLAKIEAERILSVLRDRQKETAEV